ncbi:MAG: hypothetical protein A2049_06430 [Elusimicrobia bacterium GWA2_62_23]|nr:MAG: hypothetical protein A2049_06430 [Elusimicrobia bacterium GWA2_62_23]OGR66965.1 MAG: hypothetical protein A2179_00635 [Elusimicrobia bacterium GWC2_63_65]
MFLPPEIHKEDLAFPIRYTLWETPPLKKFPLHSLLLLPLIFMLVGLVGFHLEGTLGKISLGMWLALIWSYASLPMLYFGHVKINKTFEALDEIIPDKQKKLELLKTSHSHLNNPSFWVYGVAMAALGWYVFFPAYYAAHQSLWLCVWGSLLFVIFGLVGGYGAACVVSFYGLVDKLLHAKLFKPDPYHPDLFMGFRPLGTLAVVNALVASSGSLLFPLILESRELPGIFKLPGYAMFIAIAIIIALAFIVPIIWIRDHIEENKFRLLKEHEAEYKGRLADYMKRPAPESKDLLQLLQAERAKLEEIRLFPFETKMITQVAGSLLLPFIILYLQIKYK